MKNIPFLTFLGRSWLLILLAVVSVFLAINHQAFDIFGPLVYVVAVSSVASVMARLIVQLHYRNTIDKDSHSGRYELEWTLMDPKTRIILTVVTKGVIFLGICIIAASVGR